MSSNTQFPIDLLLAAEKNDIDTVRKLANRNNVNVQDKGYFGKTLLHYAAYDGYTDLCALLIEKGAKVNLQDDGVSTPLLEAALKGHASTCKLLLEKGANNTMQDVDGWTVLIGAACHGHTETCKFLLEHGANVNMQDNSGVTPLIRSAYHGHINTCELLLEKGANVNMQDDYGLTSLSRSACHGHTKICELLIEHGANVNIQDSKGFTPLLLAVQYKHFATSKSLLEHGADVNIKTKEGKSANDFANDGKDENIIALIDAYINKKNDDKKIEEARKQLKMLEIERNIKIKKEKLKEIEEYKSCKQQNDEKEVENQEIQNDIHFLLSRIEQTNAFLKKKTRILNIISETNAQYQEKVSSLLDEISTNNRIISKNKDKMKSKEVKTENYNQLKQDIEHMEKCFKEGKYDEIIQDINKECPICFEEMQPPIYQCPEGHILCEDCLHNICASTKKCPFCAVILDLNSRIRNRSLEEMIINDGKREAKI